LLICYPLYRYILPRLLAMAAFFCPSSAWILASSLLAASVRADETCMLQNPSVSAVIQRAFPQAEGPKKSVDEILRTQKRQSLTLLEADSSVDSEAEETYVNFHNPRVWGPAGWFFFHSIALSQPDNIDSEQQERLRRFFTEDMPHILPCPQCGRNAEDHIQDMDIDDNTFNSRSGVAQFVWTLHNIVNDEKLARNEDVHVVSYEQSEVNFAQAFHDDVTRLHFVDDNSESESAALVKLESESADADEAESESDADNSESEFADADNSEAESADVDNSESESADADNSESEYADNSEMDTAAVDISESPQEHRPVELLVSQTTSAPESSTSSSVFFDWLSWFRRNLLF